MNWIFEAKDIYNEALEEYKITQYILSWVQDLVFLGPQNN